MLPLFVVVGPAGVGRTMWRSSGKLSKVNSFQGCVNSSTDCWRKIAIRLTENPPVLPLAQSPWSTSTIAGKVAGSAAQCFETSLKQELHDLLVPLCVRAL